MIADQLIKHFDRISEAPDAIPSLRQFVLNLAVRGKLVEQDKNDGHACELMRQILQEKAGLFEAGKLKYNPSLTLPKATDFAFSLPDGWAAASLFSVCLSITDGDHLPPPKTDSGVPFLVIGDVRTKTLDFADCRFVSEEYYNALDSIRRPTKGDILYTLVGSYGIPIIVNDDKRFCVQRHIGILRPSALICLRFLYRVLESKWVLNQATNCATGIAQKTVPLAGLRKILLPLPPLGEQQRIADKVDELTALCDKLEELKAQREKRRHTLVSASLHHLNNGADAKEFRRHSGFYLNHLPDLTARAEHIKQLRQSIRSLAVRGKLVCQVLEDEPVSKLLERIGAEKLVDAPFPVPPSWAWISLSQIADSRLGKMLDKAKNKGINRRYLRNVNVRWFDFDLSDIFEMRFEEAELDEFALHRGDVLICEGGEPGRAAVWDERESDIYFQKAIHRVRFAEGVDPHFFVNVLRESADSGRLAAYFTGVGIKHFTGKGLSSYVFPVPPIDEQRRIVDQIGHLMDICDRLETQITKAGDETRRFLETVLYSALQSSNLQELAAL